MSVVTAPNAWTAEPTPQRPGIFVRLWRWLFGTGPAAPAAPQPTTASRQHREHRDERRDQRPRDSRRGGRDRDSASRTPSQRAGLAPRRWWPPPFRLASEARWQSMSPPLRRRFPNHRLSVSAPRPSLETRHHVRIEPLRKIGSSAAIVPSAVNVAVAAAGAVGVAADVIARENRDSTGVAANGPESTQGPARTEPAPASSNGDERPAPRSDSGQTAELPFSSANQRGEPRPAANSAAQRDDAERATPQSSGGRGNSAPQSGREVRGMDVFAVGQLAARSRTRRLTRYFLRECG